MRLDEESEHILCKIQLKRNGLNAVDDETKKLYTETSEANDEMRKLEKSLVKLLVEQQKMFYPFHHEPKTNASLAVGFRQSLPEV